MNASRRRNLRRRIILLVGASVHGAGMRASRTNEHSRVIRSAEHEPSPHCRSVAPGGAIAAHRAALAVSTFSSTMSCTHTRRRRLQRNGQRLVGNEIERGDDELALRRIEDCNQQLIDDLRGSARPRRNNLDLCAIASDGSAPSRKPCGGRGRSLPDWQSAIGDRVCRTCQGWLCSIAVANTRVMLARAGYSGNVVLTWQGKQGHHFLGNG